MLRPVVVGVDGSAESLAAVEWAAREAMRRDRPLCLVHAWHWSPHWLGAVPADAPERLAASRTLRAAEDRIAAVYPEVPLRAVQVEGPAAPVLVRAAKDAELLVTGSRGLSGLTGFLVGSVALGVVARATGPVILVRGGEQATDEHEQQATGRPSTTTSYSPVVLGVDLGDPCDPVIEFAFEAARLRDARLHVVHTWSDPSGRTLGPGEISLVDEPRRAEEWHGFLTAVLQLWRDKYPDVVVAESVAQGRPAARLLSAATGASLLVVGRHVRAQSHVRPQIGPVTHAVVQHAGCPVAVVPHG
ncbi:MAG TPA: universal stress protein [Streptomyces sp.]|nr:universal stress protein [Streptomyces sp.]